MTDLIILNSSFTIIITLQNWPSDTFGPFTDALIKKGFTVNLPTTIQQMQVQQANAPFARKGTTTGLTTDYQNRRIPFQITNNKTSPHDNLIEVLSVLDSIGFPNTESVERIDIQGTVTIKIQDGIHASRLVGNIIKQQFLEEAKEIFERDIKTVGIRISSTESFHNIDNSPFLILLEPLFTDYSDTKVVANITYVSLSSEESIQFLQNLYTRLKSIIMKLGNGE